MQKEEKKDSDHSGESAGRVAATSGGGILSMLSNNWSPQLQPPRDERSRLLERVNAFGDVMKNLGALTSGSRVQSAVKQPDKAQSSPFSALPPYPLRESGEALPASRRDEFKPWAGIVKRGPFKPLSQLQEKLARLNADNKDFEEAQKEKTQQYMKVCEEKGVLSSESGAIWGELCQNRDRYLAFNRERANLQKAIATHPSLLQERKQQADVFGRKVTGLQAYADSLGRAQELSGMPGRHNGELRSARRAMKQYEDGRQILLAPSRFDDSGVWRNYGIGARDRITDPDFYTLGASEIVRNLDMRDTLQKVVDNAGTKEIDEVLNRGERELLESFVQKTVAETGRTDDLSLVYQSGGLSVDILEGIIENALVGGATKSLTAAARKNVSKWIARNINQPALKEARKGLVWGTDATISAAVRTPLNPSTYVNVSGRLVQPAADDEGVWDENRRPALNSYWDALSGGMVDSFIGNFADGASVHLKGMAGLLPQELKKAWSSLGEDIATSVPGKMFGKLSATPAYKFFRTHIAGETASQWGDQWYENNLRSLLGDKQALEDFETVKGQIMAFGSIVPMVVATSGSLASGSGLRYEHSRKVFQGVLAQLVGDEGKARELVDEMDTRSATGFADAVAPLINRYASENPEMARQLCRAASDFTSNRGKYYLLWGKQGGEEVPRNTGGDNGEIVPPASLEDGNRKPETPVANDRSISVATEITPSSSDSREGQGRQETGVFYREGLGDIDLRWDGGASPDAMSLIGDIVSNGQLVRNGKRRMTVTKGGNQIVLRRNIRTPEGRLLPGQNWVVTEFGQVNKPAGKGK